MTRTISIGRQGFENLRMRKNFYVDKTGFVRDWWLADDDVTLICRPRRFGKTLNLDTVRCFLSTDLAGRGTELFGGLDIWEGGSDAEREAMRALQGTIPVVSISFARVKQSDFPSMLKRFNTLMVSAVQAHSYLWGWSGLSKTDRERLDAVRASMDATTCADVPNMLCDLLRRYHDMEPVVLIDEYDAPMQEAWAGGFWDEACSFMRDLMNSTFKTNPAMGRGLITGVTRVSRESVFSDLNNLEVVTTSSTKYRTAFGFTEDETFDALDEYGLGDTRKNVREWYDGFTFGGTGHIYNPWSVTKYLESGGIIDSYWANTSGNALASSVVRGQGARFERDFETLLNGGAVEKVIDEQVVFSELERRPNAAWAMLLASGYVTSPGPVPTNVTRTPRPLRLTNEEVRLTFDRMAEGWFIDACDDYDDFCDALLAGDARTATRCLTDVTLYCMSSFDGGRRPAESEPERFYHGLVLGLLAKLRGRWTVESNRESGYGRYDVALVPTDGATGANPAVVMEFKVFDPELEDTLADTVARARKQIEEKRYVAGLVARGIAPERIRTYGIAFRGKEVLVG
ncbi:MAG: AAA family ATPase [Atopobiaceae bacterium]|nr:AAA family ATPase [Atopobiaceae bacterium]